MNEKAISETKELFIAVTVDKNFEGSQLPALMHIKHRIFGGVRDNSELPDEIRVPLHKLMADVGHLFALVALGTVHAYAMADEVKVILQDLELAIKARLSAAGDALGNNDGQ